MVQRDNKGINKRRESVCQGKSALNVSKQQKREDTKMLSTREHADTATNQPARNERRDWDIPRRERDRARRRLQRRNCTIGEIVIRHFPELGGIDSNNWEENAKRIETLEAVLAELAADTELLDELKHRGSLNRGIQLSLFDEANCQLPCNQQEQEI